MSTTTDLIKSAEESLDLMEKHAARVGADVDAFITGAEALCKRAQLDTESIAKVWALLGSQIEKYAAAAPGVPPGLAARDATHDFEARNLAAGDVARQQRLAAQGQPQPIPPRSEGAVYDQELANKQLAAGAAAKQQRETPTPAPEGVDSQPWYTQMLNNWNTNPGQEFGKLLPGMLVGGLGGALYSGLRGGAEKDRPGFLRGVLLPALLGGGLGYAGLQAAPHIRNMWNASFGTPTAKA